MADLTTQIDALAERIGSDLAGFDTRLSAVDLAALEAQIARLRSGAVMGVPEVPVTVTTSDLVVQNVQSPENISHGVDRFTGQPLEGWDHVVQSIGVILTTRIGSRLLRRWFGAGVPGLLDENGTEDTLLAFRERIAEALWLHEPRFMVTFVHVTQAERTGVFGLKIDGIYYPRGHLGDEELTEDRSLFFTLN